MGGVLEALAGDVAKAGIKVEVLAKTAEEQDGVDPGTEVNGAELGAMEELSREEMATVGAAQVGADMVKETGDIGSCICRFLMARSQMPRW